MNLTYIIKEDGYEIYNNGKLWITQYEPYIPNKNLSYEENAIAQIEELTTPVEKPVDRIAELEAKIAEQEQAISELKALIAQNNNVE